MQVRAFLEQHCKNHGVLDLLGPFLTALVSARPNCIWKPGDARILLGLYPRFRETIQEPSPLCMSAELVPALQLHSTVALAYWELAFSARTTLNLPLPERFREEDLSLLSLLLSRPEVVSLVPAYKQRFSWLMAQLEMVRGRPEIAALHLSQVISNSI